MRVLLRNGHLIDPATGRDETLDILIADGLIERIGQGIKPQGGVEVHDLGEKIIAPGFIDMHVHLREPGFEYKETIETGCSAAAAGGFTAVCCMPNTDPPIDEAPVVRLIMEKARAAAGGIVDVHPIGAVSKGRAGKELAPMLELAEAGAVGFSDDGAPVESDDLMRRALEYAAMTRRPVIQHAESMSLSRGGVMNEGFVSTSLGMPGIPSVGEEIIVARDLHLVGFTGSPYHVAHISTAGAVELVRQAKRRGLPVTCEVTPHHFTLTDEAVRSFDTNTKMNPPLRTQQDVEAMKEGLRDGTIDAIASDHAPHSYDDKQVEFACAPFGIVGLETALALAMTELVETGVLSLSQLVEKLSFNPRRILGLPAIRIEEGAEANLTMFDPRAEWKVDATQFRSRSRNSPFIGRVLRGRSIGIINNGRIRLDRS